MGTGFLVDLGCRPGRSPCLTTTDGNTRSCMHGACWYGGVWPTWPILLTETADTSGRRTVSPLVSGESRYLCALGAERTGLPSVLDKPTPPLLPAVGTDNRFAAGQGPALAPAAPAYPGRTNNPQPPRGPALRWRRPRWSRLPPVMVRILASRATTHLACQQLKR